MTPKVHAVFYHVSEFCEKKQMGLGFFSEQEMECVHFEFKRIWQRSKYVKAIPSTKIVR